MGNEISLRGICLQKRQKVRIFASENMVNHDHNPK